MRAMAQDLKDVGISGVTLYKTSSSAEDCVWGLGIRSGDRDYYGLDENPDVIL